VPAYRGLMGAFRVSVSTALVLVLATGACLEAGVLVALERSGPEVAAAAGMSMDQAVKMAEKRFKAKVVRAEAQRDGARTIYVLKLLNDAGRVWTVRVDAANGAIL
jgi:hypothetical protein